MVGQGGSGGGEIPVGSHPCVHTQERGRPTPGEGVASGAARGEDWAQCLPTCESHTILVRSQDGPTSRHQYRKAAENHGEKAFGAALPGSSSGSTSNYK